MADKKLTKTQKTGKSLLTQLRILFGGKEKEIKAIKVWAGTQKFWVKNPKKIQYYQKLADYHARFMFNNNNVSNPIEIKKVLYK